jgi:hypothetical protein
MTELDVSIDAALVHLDRAATEAALHDDPLQLPFAALASFLRAQKALYVDGAASLAQHLEQARQPIRDEELQKAVVRGIRAHAVAIVQAINWRTAAYLVMTALCIGGLGFGTGVWWQSDRLAAEVETAYNTVVAVHDGFGSGLKAIDASVWLDLIRLNGNIREAIRQCQPMKEPAGTACAVPMWLMLPPPKTEPAYQPSDPLRLIDLKAQFWRRPSILHA